MCVADYREKENGEIYEFFALDRPLPLHGRGKTGLYD